MEKYKHVIEFKSDDHHTLHSNAIGDDGKRYGFMTTRDRGRSRPFASKPQKNLMTENSMAEKLFALCPLPQGEHCFDNTNSTLCLSCFALAFVQAACTFCLKMRCKMF
jgi:hypothetical protein